MSKFIIKVTCGAYSAPSLIEMATSRDEAIKQAKERSRLADFPNVWKFI